MVHVTYQSYFNNLIIIRSAYSIAEYLAWGPTAKFISFWWGPCLEFWPPFLPDMSLKIERVDKEIMPQVWDSRFGIVWQLSCWYEYRLGLAAAEVSCEYVSTVPPSRVSCNDCDYSKYFKCWRLSRIRWPVGRDSRISGEVKLDTLVRKFSLLTYAIKPVSTSAS